MTRKDRVRLIVGLVLTLAIVGTAGVDVVGQPVARVVLRHGHGRADYGGGPGASSGEHHDMENMSHDSSVSVADLDTAPSARPTSSSTSPLARARCELASGETVEGYTLNGTSPGPLIEATVGQLVEVRLHNESVKGGVALHWHGVDVPNAQDGVAGVTQDAVGVGRGLHLPLGGTGRGSYWYHSHQLSNEQVSGGLLGGIVVHPEERETGVRDVIAVAHLYDGVRHHRRAHGLSGRSRARPGERVRVRLVNTDNGPQNAWAGAPFLVRAVDGVDVNEPTEVTDRSVSIPAGGRADLEVRVPTDGSAVRVADARGRGPLDRPAGQRVRGREAARGGARPARLRLLRRRRLRHGKPDREFEYSVGRRPGFLNGKPGLWWSVNGKLYPDMPMFVVREGDVVKVRISNHSGESHPMHLHGHHAVVLSRDGVEASGSPWWFDSLEVQNGESFDVAFVADNPGIWMDHCHNLKHAARGPGDAPDVRRRDHAVQAGRGLRQHPGVTEAAGDRLV